MARLPVSVTIAGLSHLFPDGLRGLVEAARIADDAGIDQLTIPDHVTIGPRLDRYPYGPFPLPKEAPWLEPLTALSAFAGATQRIRLSTGILIAPLRPAVLLAKTVATLDVLSNGRVDLGVGTGWQREEYEASGLPFAGRSERLDDTLRACRRLWRDAPAAFSSHTTHFEDVWSYPQPLQEGGIPISLGMAATERNLSRFVEFDAGWLPMTSDPDALRRGIDTIRNARAAAGLDPAGLLVRANAPIVSDASGRPDLARSLEAGYNLQAIGVSMLAFALPVFAARPDDVPPFLESLGRRAR
jgi:probable F420-dependent oxidoreductase